MRGKAAIITGSTSGIGLAVAQTLAATGADIMLSGLGNAADVESLRQSMAKTYGVRRNSPEQTGALVAFLCSHSAAQIRGTVLPLDPAWTAQ
jgi:NAD(P)-dependent dehydrogenase (short-subunit alcohol dehydrogenase family)